jgi:hypothetical protein
MWDCLFNRMQVGSGLVAVVGDSDTAAKTVPLFVLAQSEEHFAGVHVFTRIRFSDRDALFIRVTDTPLSWRPEDGLLSVLTQSAELARRNSLFLNNHQCYYLKLFEGEELEHKYRLDASLDIWGVTVKIYNAVRDGDLQGYVPEYGDEFQSWDYLNILFEVPSPSLEQGYISFIPLSTGGYTIKRKWFIEDATRRGERHYREPNEISDLESYLRKRFAVNPVPYPPFQLVRYDINFESLATGHVYGMFFDHSRLVDNPEIAMAQCELEYLRTRSVLPVSDDDVWAELEEIATWLEGFLADNGIVTERGVYSKLSFLRDNCQPTITSAETGS